MNYSGNFAVLDGGATVKAGEIGEAALIDLISQERFAPGRSRPYAIQAIGMTPDVPLTTSAGDLADGGSGAIKRVVGELVKLRLLPSSQ